VLSIASVVFWERKDESGGPRGRVGIGVVWERFPKFVLGFFAASVIMSLVAALPPEDHVGRAGVEGTFKSKAQKREYDADFSDYEVPASLADRFSYDPQAGEISFRGKMSLEQLRLLAQDADEQQRWALKQLHYSSDWFDSELYARVIAPIKKLRSWAFVLCFLAIGLSTRFKDLLTFGLKPFWAFTIGVLVNVPLGWLLSTRVFDGFWKALQ
jgi:hypothetical protein